MIADPPFFTIITVSWNNLNGLKTTADSVKCQTFKDFEWWVIDGGSDDGSYEWLENCSIPQLAWISEPDEGIYHGMNKGIDNSKGQYLIFMNAGDDFASPDVLAKTFNEIKSHPADVLYGDSFEVAQGRRLLKTAFPHTRIWYSMFTHHQSIFYARKAIGEIRYPGNLEISGDRALTAKIFMAGSSFRRLSFPICVFERGGISQSTDPQIRKKMYYERRWVNEHILGMSRLKSTMTLFAKHAAEKLRLYFPKVYDKIRFRQE